MQILAGVNGTERSLAAVRFATRLSVPGRDSLTLYFSPPKVRIERQEELVAAIPQSLAHAFAEAVFGNVRADLPDGHWTSVETIVGAAAPNEGLLIAVQQARADLLVVGADSHPKRFGFYLGGVAHTVAQQARIPVLVYRAREERSPRHGLRVLLADDGSSAAAFACHFLHQFHWPEGSEGWLIRVLEWLDFSGITGEVLSSEVHATWRSEYDRHLSEARARVFDELKVKQQGLPAIFHGLVPLICDGHRVQEICETVEREGIDLVVLGARNLSPMQRFLGSTTEGLLRHCPCSILVVHEPEKA